jgi:hypothetical protein
MVFLDIRAGLRSVWPQVRRTAAGRRFFRSTRRRRSGPPVVPPGPASVSSHGSVHSSRHLRCKSTPSPSTSFRQPAAGPPEQGPARLFRGYGQPKLGPPDGKIVRQIQVQAQAAVLRILYVFGYGRHGSLILWQPSNQVFLTANLIPGVPRFRSARFDDRHHSLELKVYVIFFYAIFMFI